MSKPMIDSMTDILNCDLCFCVCFEISLWYYTLDNGFCCIQSNVLCSSQINTYLQIRYARLLMNKIPISLVFIHHFFILTCLQLAIIHDGVWYIVLSSTSLVSSLLSFRKTVVKLVINKIHRWSGYRPSIFKSWSVKWNNTILIANGKRVKSSPSRVL